MATDVLIPKLGMTMTEGTLAEWMIPDGAEVKAGQILYHLETEKIEFDVEAESDGTVAHLVPAGTTLPPGALVGYVLAPGETRPIAPAPSASPGMGTSPAQQEVRPVQQSSGAGGGVASPIARRLAGEAGLDLASVTGSGPGGRITEADVRAALSSTPAPPAPEARQASTAEVLASPLARKLAQSLRVDLALVRGTGPGGRITQEDVEAAASAAPPAPASVPPQRGLPGTIVPMRAMRKVIAERMHASLQEMAQLTMAMEVVMDDAVKLRGQLIEEWASQSIRPSYTDLVIKAVAKSLVLHPRLNARVTAAGIELEPTIAIGMAVALDEGLVVPVVRDADYATLREIAAETTRLAEAARNGKLAMDDMAGQTFSVTALGMAGIDFFTPIINPPNVAILGVGRVHDGTAWVGNLPVRRQVMTLSLTVDHRAVDGAPGAAFLNDVRALLESPYRLLI